MYALVCLAPAAIAFTAPAASPAAPPSAPAAASEAGLFTTQVQPLLQRRCLGCHGVGARLSGLDLRSGAGALKGGTRGPALVPGNAGKSVLYQMVSGYRQPRMPPTGPLSAAEVALVKRWIDAGAPWPEGTIQEARKQVWWSFRPPVMPAVPAIRDPWIRTPVDAFVLANLRAAGLSPSPRASRRVLIRRTYLDLLGLPPPPAEVQAFERDTAPDAWEKVVDRLLASPHYGERWGRHWLDLVRYADSSGFEGDKDRPLAWRYRDYVIDAFNRDKPYDQFIREQLAGDELRPGDPESLVATGYLACGPQDQVEKNAKTRADELDDLVSTTGSVFLGLTVACARCHDHKYDPIPQKDYYRLQALFAPSERREIEVAPDAERRAIAAHNAVIEKELAPLRAQAESLRQRGAELAKRAHPGDEKPSDDQVAAALPEAERQRLAAIETAIHALEAKRLAAEQALVVTDAGRDFPATHLLIRGDAYHPGPEVSPGFLACLAGGAADIGPAPAEAKTTGRRLALANWITSPQNPLTARVWVNRVWRQHFGSGLVNTPSNFGVSGELPSNPELLDWLAATFCAPRGVQGSGFTVQDAQCWIQDTRCATPGAGCLPRSPGAQHRASSIEHPASSIQHRASRDSRPNAERRTLNAAPALAWRTKALHRLVLLSATYQQASGVRPEAMMVDPQDRLYWRMPVRRLEAEAIRDSILAVAGTLDERMGGPPVYPPVDPSLRADTFLGYNWPEAKDTPDTWRRSIYVKVKRSLILPELDVFDCPEITASVPQRNVTTSPTQALTLLNDPVVLHQAALFAERVERETGGATMDHGPPTTGAPRANAVRPSWSKVRGPSSGEALRRAQIERAYWLAFSRPPTAREITLGQEFVQKRSLSDFCHAIFNLNEFVYVP